MSLPFLRLRQDVSHIATDSSLTLRSGGKAITVSGPGAAFVATSILPLLDGTRTVDTVCAELAEVDPEDVHGLLEALESHGLLAGARTLKSTGARRVTIGGDAAFMTAMGCAIRDAGLIPQGPDDILPGGAPAAGIFAIDDEAGIAAFVAAARGTGTGSIALLADGALLLSAPAARPGVAGCWHCALLRYGANRRWRAPAGDAASIDPTLAARLMLDALAGIGPDEALVVTDARSRASTVHRFLPVPGCPVCGGPRRSAQAPSREGQDVDSAAFAMIDRFVDPLTGVINRLVIEPVANTGLEAPIVVTAIAADAPREARAMPPGWGKGHDLPAAIVGAIGEAIERYAASMPDPARIVTARIDALDGDVLDPRDFALYRGDQYERSGFPFARFDAEAHHPWVRGRWIDGGPVWVPAVLTYLALDLGVGQAFCQGTSNGLAAGASADEASIRALLELIERDAFLTAWMCDRPGRRLHLDESLAPELRAVLDGLEALGARIEATLLESACGYPVVACFGFGDGMRWPGVTLGLGADPDPRVALAQAIMELGQTGPYLRALMRDQGSIAQAAGVADMLDHARYYFPAGREARFARMIAGEAIGIDRLPPPRERSLAACGRSLRRAGIRAALIDVTPADIAQTPIRVIRAVSPDLQPIAFGYGQERRPIPRLAALGINVPASEITPLW